MGAETLQLAVRLLRRYALWFTSLGLVSYVGGLSSIYFGVLTPFEAAPFVFLGQAVLIVGLVLWILSRIARRIEAAGRGGS